MAGFSLSAGDSFAQRDFYGLLDWVVVDAATDCRERKSAQAVLACQAETIAITTREQLWLVVVAAIPDWAYGVKDVFCGQAIAFGELRVAGLASAE